MMEEEKEVEQEVQNRFLIIFCRTHTLEGHMVTFSFPSSSFLCEDVPQIVPSYPSQMCCKAVNIVSSPCLTLPLSPHLHR